MLLWLFFATTVFFGVIAVYFSYKYEKRGSGGVSKSSDQDKDLKRQLYEVKVLSQITDKIGYSLNVQTVAETIAETVENIFDLSTVSYAVCKFDSQELIMKTFIKENVGANYIGWLKGIMLTAIGEIDPAMAKYPIKQEANAILPQSDRYTYFDAIPQSYFNIPMIVDDRLIGMINISSQKKHVYEDADMSLLYKIVAKAQEAVTRLHDVIETEKAKLESVISHLPSGTIMFSFQGNTVGVPVLNRAAREFLKVNDGVSAQDIVSHFGGGMDLIREIKDVIAQGKPNVMHDVEINGQKFTLFITPVYLHNTQNVVVVSLIMHELQMNSKVDQVKQDFTNMIVHELRAPASAIKGASNLLLSGSLSATDQIKMENVISASANDMLRTIEDILDYAKAKDGKLTIKKAKSDLEKLILEHIQVFGGASQEKNIELKFSHEGEVPEFYFDPLRIGEVVNNLISNAIKFSRQDGKIDIKVTRKDGSVEVSVCDDGVGIPEREKSILFTKFGQVDGASSEELAKDGSSGLGLFLSKEIIESHGGKIWLESEEGKGTHVFFTLPLLMEDTNPAVSSIHN